MKRALAAKPLAPTKKAKYANAHKVAFETDFQTMHFAVCSSRCTGEGAADDPQLERCSTEDLQHGEEDLHRAAFTIGEFDSVSAAEVQVERGHYLYRVRSL